MCSYSRKVALNHGSESSHDSWPCYSWKTLLMLQECWLGKVHEDWRPHYSHKNQAIVYLLVYVGKVVFIGLITERNANVSMANCTKIWQFFVTLGPLERAQIFPTLAEKFWKRNLIWNARTANQIWHCKNILDFSVFRLKDDQHPA